MKPRATVLILGLLGGGLLLFEQTLGAAQLRSSRGAAQAADAASGTTANAPAALAVKEAASGPGAGLPLDTGDFVARPARRAAARAQRQPPDLKPFPPDRMNVRLEVLAGGKPLPTIQHRGKTYLPVAHLGTEYQIRVWNHGPRRVVALVSVDGLSVINGQPASDANPGYVVAPYSQVPIKGWRRDLDTVAAFRFVERGKSYAALMGQPEKVGLISLVAIEERELVRPLTGLDRKEATSSAKKGYGKVGGIGTEYGREIDSGAYYVPFLRSGNKRVVTFYYDTVEALRAAGVPLDMQPPAPIESKSPFAPPLPGYKGK